MLPLKLMWPLCWGYSVRDVFYLYLLFSSAQVFACTLTWVLCDKCWFGKRGVFLRGFLQTSVSDHSVVSHYKWYQTNSVSRLCHVALITSLLYSSSFACKTAVTMPLRVLYLKYHFVSIYFVRPHKKMLALEPAYYKTSVGLVK